MSLGAAPDVAVDELAVPDALMLPTTTALDAEPVRLPLVCKFADWVESGAGRRSNEPDR